MAAITGKSACKGPEANDISGTIGRQAQPIEDLFSSLSVEAPTAKQTPRRSGCCA
jgi:hypothetical protein